MQLDLSKDVLTGSLVLLVICLVVWFITVNIIRKVGKNSGINDARIRLITRYFSITLILVAFLIEFFVLGVDLNTLAVVFSSTFAVIGIAFFAIWSILSNITSGVIMFFSFPYKVGDKIKIHDKEFPVEAIIEDIRAFQLHLRLEDGDLITYPNNLILQKPVTLVKKDAIEDIHVDI